MQWNSLFITIEGPEGSGKSTLIQKLARYYEQKLVQVCITREPGGVKIAEKIRDVILDVEHTTMDAKTEALLYAAARRQHLVEKVKPAMEQGKLVLCDRFIDSSIVYQGIGRGLGIEEVMNLNTFAIESLMPNYTILLDLDVSVGLSRIQQNRSNEVNRLDLETVSFHEKVRSGYLQMAEKFPERIVVFDANASQEEIFQQVVHWLDKKLMVR